MLGKHHEPLPNLITTWSVVSNHSKIFLYNTSYTGNYSKAFWVRKTQLNSSLTEQVTLNKNGKKLEKKKKSMSDILILNNWQESVKKLLSKHELKITALLT